MIEKDLPMTHSCWPSWVRIRSSLPSSFQLLLTIGDWVLAVKPVLFLSLSCLFLEAYWLDNGFQLGVVEVRVKIKILYPRNAYSVSFICHSWLVTWLYQAKERRCNAVEASCNRWSLGCQVLREGITWECCYVWCGSDAGEMKGCWIIHIGIPGFVKLLILLTKGGWGYRMHTFCLDKLYIKISAENWDEECHRVRHMGSLPYHWKGTKKAN